MSKWFKIGNFIALLFLVGATIMSFFLILSGGREGGTLENFYWLKANTTGFNDAPDETRWFNYQFCGYGNGDLFNCSSRAPAKPFSPRDNFGASPLMPSSFLNNRDTYYYLSRVAWAMLLIAVFCEVVTLIPQLIGIFKHIRILSILATVFHWLSLFFILLAACLYTGCYAKATRAFHSEDRSARMGAKCFALLWTSVFLLLCTSIWSVVATVLKKKEERNRPSYYATTTAAGVGGATAMNNRVDDDDGYGYANTTDKSSEVADNLGPNAIATVTPPPTSTIPSEQQPMMATNATTAKHKYFNKLRTKNKNKNAGDGEHLLTTTKEEEEYEVPA